MSITCKTLSKFLFPTKSQRRIRAWMRQFYSDSLLRNQWGKMVKGIAVMSFPLR